jgi:NDP-sugar pyrophosphorylase family protein
MYPLTAAAPKNLIPVAGRPFADYQLSWLAREGVTDVVYCIAHLGEQIRDYVGDGSRWSLRVQYVDEGEQLRGTAGALRLGLEQGVLADTFLLLYGDSYLPIHIDPVVRAFERSGKPALMTVLRNCEQWDRSNVCFRDNAVLLYDKTGDANRPIPMEYVDYGLSVLKRSFVEAFPAGVPADLAGIWKQASVNGQLAGFEIAERFYEIGSPAGLADFASYAEQARL